MRKNNFMRRDFLKTLGMGAAALAMPASNFGERTAASKPNFIVIFTDDQGYQDLGCFGSPKIDTPNIDAMAEAGMRFTDFYAAESVCSPSRAALLTGCYPPRTGITRVLFPRHNTGLGPEQTTIASMLKKIDYATTCIGKWHLGHKPKYLPTSKGFDSYFGIPYSNDMKVDPKMDFAKDCNWRKGQSPDNITKKKDWVPLMRDEKVVEYPCDQTTLTRRYTQEALDFIDTNKEKPFFLYLAHTMPHVPLYASPEFNDQSERGLYGDVIEEIDWGVGKITARLKELGIEDNTLIVYTSDNGPWLQKGKNGGSAEPLRGGKFTAWEGGFREPTVMQWPGKIPAGKECDKVASTIDLLPTFAHLSGAPLPSRKIDGKNIWPLMEGRQGIESPHEYYCYCKGKGVKAIRSGPWKLKDGKLYNLRKDIGEEHDIAEDNPAIVKRLANKMKEFQQDMR